MFKEFDKTFGLDFIQSVPNKPGVYIFKRTETIIYVGKAKNLKTRLSQYRGATRKKIHQKMRQIVKEASCVLLQNCESEKEALVLENRLIQTHQPKFNVSGAYSFLYPYLGLAAAYKTPKWLAICYTTHPDEFKKEPFELYGSFRSRHIVQEAYDSLVFLLDFIGHKDLAERKKLSNLTYSRVTIFRQIPNDIQNQLKSFLSGKSEAGLACLLELLLEKGKARKQASEIQMHLKKLKTFYKQEGKKLREVLDQLGTSTTFIDQKDRDRLFIEHKYNGI